MEMADYWLTEKDLIPKLFSVLVPRLEKSHHYTDLHYLPISTPSDRSSNSADIEGKAHRLPQMQFTPMAVLELKGNPWPPIVAKQPPPAGSIVNVLVQAARRESAWESRRAKKQRAAVAAAAAAVPPTPGRKYDPESG